MKFLALFEYERNAWWIPLAFEAETFEDVPAALTKLIIESFTEDGDYVVSEHGDFISDRSVQVYALAVDGAPMTFNPELWKAARKLAFEELAHNRRENARMSRERDERRQLDVLKKKYGE